jgi:hypothetical protein
MCVWTEQALALTIMYTTLQPTSAASINTNVTDTRRCKLGGEPGWQEQSSAAQ